MSCSAVTSSNAFLLETLSHIDCQVQTIGNVGFHTLSTPGSPASALLTALLTIFIALFGIRLLFTDNVGIEDGIGAALKVAIVVTLALSWPAYRVLAYETVLYGPWELSTQIIGPSTGTSQNDLTPRLQGIDDKIVALTALGTGRQTGSLKQAQGETVSFKGVALEDEAAFGWSRTLYLAFTIGPLAALRIAAGLLLALGPIFAGLLLFDVTRGLFAGWLRGLTLTALGSLGLTLLLSIQAAIMEPWLAGIISRRTMGYATPSAPTELIALALSFAIASLGLLAILSRVAFQNSWPSLPIFVSRAKYGEDALPRSSSRLQDLNMPAYASVQMLSSIQGTSVQQNTVSLGRGDRRMQAQNSSPLYLPQSSEDSALGSSYRHGIHLKSPSRSRRDSKQ